MAQIEVPTNSEIEDEIRESINDGVESITVDGLTVREIPLKQRLDALDRLTGRTADGKKHFGLRITQLISPGCGP